jgi:uncharacterized membrane protein
VAGCSQPEVNRAIEIVMEPYARGEITDKEYESMRCTIGDR